MKLATLAEGAAPCVLAGTALIAFAAADALGMPPLPGSVRALLALGDGLARAAQLAHYGGTPAALARLRTAGLARDAAGAVLLAPLPDPGLVVCAGPPVFFKPQTCVIGPAQAVVLPPRAPAMVAAEGALCIVFGRYAYRISAADAFGVIAGYACGCDVGARDVPFLGKLFPTFLPLGPYLVTGDEVSDAAALRVRTRLNGGELQNVPALDAAFGVAELVAHWTQYVAFAPGDVLVVSPPAAGSGPKPRFLAGGDVLTVEIDGLGVLTNAVALGR